MLAPVANQSLTDGDVQFLRVDNRRAPHQLEAGTVAAARNMTFDQGRPGPRHGVSHGGWGRIGADLFPASPTYHDASHTDNVYVIVTGFTVGKRYFYMQGVAFAIATGVKGVPPAEGEENGSFQPDGTMYTQSTFFTATATSYYVFFTAPTTAPTHIFPVQKPRAFERFRDENGFDNCVLITEDWRDGMGEDGGLGRAWRICPGNAPQEIPLNGHDIYDKCKLIPVYNGLTLGRAGKERHYFIPADVDDTLDQIQLHCAQQWSDGDQVLFKGAVDGSAIYGPAPPNDNTIYFVKKISGNKVELYTDQSLSTQLTFDGGVQPHVGKFYLEWRAEAPGFYGLGPAPLLMQNNGAITAFEVGFKATPVDVVITDTDGTPETITAPNHRLVPGDTVNVTGLEDGTTTPISPTLDLFARPLSENLLLLYDTQAHALAGGATGLQTVTDDQTGTLRRKAASALPMPSWSEGVYFLQRLFVINGSNVVISDPLDVLHFTPFTSTIGAKVDENSPPVALHPLGYDTLLIFKQNQVLALQNLSQSSSSWILTEITREYGAIAPLTCRHTGSDVWGLSRRGVESIIQTAQGQIQGVSVPKSYDIPETIADIDWIRAASAAAGDWNNRYYLAAPLKNQTGEPVNNAVFVYNRLNGGWEGSWDGDFLSPVAFARLTVFGEERLAFVNAIGVVCWFSDEFTDMNAQVATELVSRAYFPSPVLALEARVNWDTFDPNITVTAKSAGYAEETELASAMTYNRSAYMVDKAADTDFSQPNREDYSMVPDSGLYTEGVPFDVHQNITEKFRMRIRDRAVQIVIANSRGSLRLNSIEVSAMPIGMAASKQT